MKSMYKKLLVGLLAVVMLVVFTACGGGKIDTSQIQSKSLMGSKNAEIRWRVGSSTAPPPGHYVSGLVDLQKRIEKYSNGKMTIDIYPSSLLGNERDMIENVGLGIQDMVITATGPVPNFVPDFSVLDFPYLFGTAEEAYAAEDGPIGQKLLAELKPLGIAKAYFWENGFRDTTNSKRALVHPSDVKGLKIRTMENTIHMATYHQLGAIATPMAYGELFTALNQKTVDGQENPPVIIATDKLYEVQKYLSITHLFYSPSVLMISEKSYNALSDDLKKVVTKAAKESTDWERAYSQKSSAAGVVEMRKAGTKINEIDQTEWRKAVQPVYDNAEKLGANVKLLKQLQQFVSDYRAKNGTETK